MIPEEVKNKLDQIKEYSNEVYYQHKLKVISLIYSFNTYKECWEGLRRWDALTIWKRERHLLDNLKENKPEVYEGVMANVESALESI